jgi:putative membrane protein
MRGRVLSEVLPGLRGADRERALACYLGAAEAIGKIALPDLPFGELLAADRPLQSESWSEFLWARLARSVASSRSDLEADVPGVGEVLSRVRVELAGLSAYDDRRLVHGDYFPGNVFVDDSGEVTGVGDFGYSTVVGDPLLDVAGAIAFLEVVDGHEPDDSVHLTRLAQAKHGVDVVRRLGLYRLYYSFYFSGCKADDPPTYAWCVESLRDWRDGGMSA